MKTNEIRIETKIGTLVAREVGDYDYPSIGIFFDNGIEEIMLSATEVDQSDKVALLRAFIYANKEFDEPTE